MRSLFVLVLLVVLPAPAFGQECLNGQCLLPQRSQRLPQRIEYQVPQQAPARRVYSWVRPRQQSNCANGQCRPRFFRLFR